MPLLQVLHIRVRSHPKAVFNAGAIMPLDSLGMGQTKAAMFLYKCSASVAVQPLWLAGITHVF